MLDKGGAALKAFVPQLQTTFVKSLNDASREVRQAAAVALGKLMHLTTRVDSMLAELAVLCQNAESSAIRTSVLDALVHVSQTAGMKSTAAAMDKVVAAVKSTISDEEDGIRHAAAKLAGSVALYMDETAVQNLLRTVTDNSLHWHASDHYDKRAGKVLAVGAVLQSAEQRLPMQLRQEVVDHIMLPALSDDRPSVKAAACT